MKRQFIVFAIRLLLNALGIWAAVHIFGTGHPDTATFWQFLVAAIIFSVVNALLKPIIIVFSLPAILVSLGLFMIVVNGLMVYISLKLAPGFSMSFVDSILTGLLLSLLNYVISNLVEISLDRKGAEI